MYVDSNKLLPLEGMFSLNIFLLLRNTLKKCYEGLEFHLIVISRRYRHSTYTKEVIDNTIVYKTYTIEEVSYANRKAGSYIIEKLL